MIRNKRKLDEFCRELDAKENLSYKETLRIYGALHKEAVSLGAINHENIWDGFEVVLRIARAINKVGL
jgi:DNA-binding transcriptional regulator/RsmH inhibitor MraZ